MRNRRFVLESLERRLSLSDLIGSPPPVDVSKPPDTPPVDPPTEPMPDLPTGPVGPA